MLPVKLLLSLIISVVEANNKRPNILVIVADDLGWDDVGLHGSTQVRTPNIDALSSDGIRFTNYYVSPICSPSRSALFTGRHPIHTGMQHYVIEAASPWGLPLRFKILPQFLKEIGYKTHLVGKWHQGFFRKEYLPTRRGFDTHFGYWTGREDYYDHTSFGHFWGFDLWRNERPVFKEYFGQYSTTFYKEEVKAIIKSYSNSSEPFFLMFSPQAVHAGNPYCPLQVPKEFENRFSNIENTKRRKFVAMVSTLDDAIGEIFEELAKSDVLNNTIIVFTTDNGAATEGTKFSWSADNSMGSNWPLRGAKYTLWEGGVKGVAFLWSALLNKSGYTFDKLMHIQDWLPTLYSAAGGHHSNLPPDLDGLDFWDILSNKRDKELRNEILHNIDDEWKVFALRHQNYKLISGTVFGDSLDSWFEPPKSAVEKEVESESLVEKILKEKYSRKIEKKKFRINCGLKPSNVTTNCKPDVDVCLYNIKLDPCEYNNLSDQEIEIKRFMLERIRFYNKTAVAPNNQPPDPKSNPFFHGLHWDVWR